ncbi:MAG TPA: hypothetical protein VEH81_09240 [Ktedonobacteraceae bacterium]|nr:hypothetical protein [Ktedonobacteraceae bacterium]
MNVSTTGFSATQMILAWTLLVVLLSWFIIFTALAVREFILKKVVDEDVHTPSRPIPIIGVQPKEEQQHFIEVARGTKHNEHMHTELSSDSSTSLRR